ncbi:MAG: carboxymuconolactone decarboxylase family protein [Candidatus Binatia bacterium]
MTRPLRIERLSCEEALAAAREAGVPEAMAQLNIFRVLLHQPGLAKCVNDLLLTLLFRGKLDARLRELVIMRIGWVTGADYEWTQHWRVAREQFKVADEDLLALRNWRGCERFGPAERAVLTATDETLERGRISAATWTRCVAHVGGPEALVELVTAIGTWHLISQVVLGLDIPLEDGVASWPPDGLLPPAATRADEG